MTFWIAAAAIVFAAAVAVAWPVLRPGHRVASRAAHDEEIYKAQLREIDRDLARGSITEDEAATARIEISRRLLNAADQRAATEGPGPAPRRASIVMAVVTLALLPLGGFALYDDLGRAGEPDQPFAARDADMRPDQETAELMMAGAPQPEPGPDEAEFRQLVAQLETRVTEAPDDREGALLLARSYAHLGEYAKGWREFRRLIDMEGARAHGDLWAGMAEAMILATQGYVSPDAEEALGEAIKRQPTNFSTRYYLGVLFAQQEQPEIARAIWDELKADSPADAPWVEAINTQLGELDRLAVASGDPGMRGALPAPDAEAMAAADEMSPADREAMIKGMVAGLADRIAAEGGSVEEWLRLIRSYGVLGQTDLAQEALENARAAFSDQPARLAELETALSGGAPAPTPAPAPAPAATDRFTIAPIGEAADDAVAADAPPPGPDADAVAAAAAMPPEDRRAMIEGMVARLADRLAEEGGGVGDWMRLISSYSVLGMTDRIDAAIVDARADLSSRPDELSTLNAALEAAKGGAAQATPPPPPTPAPAPAPAATPRPGPSPEDIEAAAQMPAGERTAMIEGMVSRLAERLATEGGDANDYGQLIRSLGVLGRVEEASAIYAEARESFASDPIGLAFLKETALLAGVTVE